MLVIDVTVVVAVFHDLWHSINVHGRNVYDESRHPMFQYGSSSTEVRTKSCASTMMRSLLFLVLFLYSVFSGLSIWSLKPNKIIAIEIKCNFRM